MIKSDWESETDQNTHWISRYTYNLKRSIPRSRWFSELIRDWGWDISTKAEHEGMIRDRYRGADELTAMKRILNKCRRGWQSQSVHSIVNCFKWSTSGGIIILWATHSWNVNLISAEHNQHIELAHGSMHVQIQTIKYSTSKYSSMKSTSLKYSQDDPGTCGHFYNQL